jgi:hypothetical protein
MATDGEAQTYLTDLNKRVRPIATSLHEALLGLGCVSYVKTIYIGYDIDGEMVAALYGHIDHVEVALALPEDAEGDLLIDAKHLTWRTLPVAAIVRNKTDIVAFMQLALTAVEGVRTSSHTVNRDNEFFIKSRQERRDR